MKKIDAHMHVNFSSFDAERIIAYLDRHGFDRCWLHTWEEIDPPVPSIYEPLSLEEMLEAHARYPDRIVPFYAPDPGSATFRKDLEQAMQRGVRGCGELKVTLRWSDPAIEPYLQTIDALNLPLMFHMEEPRMQYVRKTDAFFEKVFDHLVNGRFNGVPGYYIRQLAGKTGLFARKLKNNMVSFPGYLYDFDGLEQRLEQFPGIRFIAHGPDFWNNLAADRHPKYKYQKGRFKQFGIIDRLLSGYPNLYCDLSGNSGFIALSRDRRQSKRFLEKHYRKVLFGTDNTGRDYEGLIHSLGLDKDMLEQVFSGNARRVLENG